MSNAWLKDLEDKVHAASKAVRDLRAENEQLTARVSELEAELEAVSGDAGGEWQQDRADIRQRVEKLADHLAELLGTE